MINITSFKIIENVFDTPDEVFSIVNTFDYREKNPLSNWFGYRTRLLHIAQPEFYKNYVVPVINKALHIDADFPITFEYSVDTYIGKLPGTYTADESWWHNDENDNLFAGVVYLNKQPTPYTGTEIVTNGKTQEVENVYNRLVIYRANTLHRALNGFGCNMSNYRTTLVFFIRSVSYELNFKKEI